MAIEAKRGCGYRKVGGLYMVGGGIGIPCDRLPFELNVCTCCGQGIKQALGWTWIDVAKFFDGPHMVPSQNLLNDTSTGPKLIPCRDSAKGVGCPLCEAPETMGRAGLLWIGEKFYKFPTDFVKEGITQGFSRRIKAVPHGFKVGQTWVMLAHSKAFFRRNPLLDTGSPLPSGEKFGEYKPGIFYAWLPQRVEKIVLESERGSEEIAALEKRGIVPIFVPDDDPDHQGNVHADHAREQREKRETDEENN